MAVGGLFLMKYLSVYVDIKVTRRYLLDTAVCLKKGDFNTPSVFLFFKKENGGFDCYFKTAVRLLTFIRRIEILPPSNGFFYIRWTAYECKPLYLCFFIFSMIFLNLSLSENGKNKLFDDK